MRKAVFNEVFVGLMRNKTRILVTHAVEFAHLADHIIVMKDGRVETQGTYEELKDLPYMTQVEELHSKNKNEVEKAHMLDALDGDNKDIILQKAKSSFDRRTTMLEKKNSNLATKMSLVRQSSGIASKKVSHAPSLRK